MTREIWLRSQATIDLDKAIMALAGVRTRYHLVLVLKSCCWPIKKPIHPIIFSETTLRQTSSHTTTPNPKVNSLCTYDLIQLYMAYLEVHSRAVLSCRVRSVLSNCAMSGTRGSSGFGSVNNEQILNNTFEIVNAGLHWSLRMSKQMPPFELMLQW